MQRVMFAAAAFVLTGALVAAEDPKPAVQPPAAQPGGRPIAQPAQPAQPRPIMVTAAKMSQMEEEYEALEANRDVKKAQVKAAEVGVRAAEVGLDRVNRLAASNAITKEEVEKAKLDVELAKVQVEIRVAELKEVEVKIRHSKKRLDDAKVGGVRPLPGGGGGARPVPVDPAPGPIGCESGEKTAEELKAKLGKLIAEAQDKADAVKKADVTAEGARVALTKIREMAQRGWIAANAFQTAVEKVAEAEQRSAELKQDHLELSVEIVKFEKKLKDIEK